MTITGRIEDNKFGCVIDGDTISVANQQGNIIGAAQMGPLTGPASDCYEDYTIPKVTTAATFYQFEWDGVVAVTYSAQQLRAWHWNVPPIYQT